MIKTKIAAALGATAMLLPFAAFASVDNVLFNNGTTGSVSAEAGSTIPMDILVSSTGTDVDSVWVNFPGAGGAAQVGRCYDINPNQIGSSPAGGWTVHVDLDRTPLNANLWDMTVSTYGLDAVDAEDNGCSTGVDFTHTFSGNDRRVTITNTPSTGSGANNSGGSGNSSGSGSGVGGTGSSVASTTSQFADLWAQLNAFKSLFASFQQTILTVIGPKPICNQLPTETHQLQDFLRDNGGFLTQAQIDTGYGTYGPRTRGALLSFRLANHCL